MSARSNVKNRIKSILKDATPATIQDLFDMAMDLQGLTCFVFYGNDPQAKMAALVFEQALNTAGYAITDHGRHDGDIAVETNMPWDIYRTRFSQVG